MPTFKFRKLLTAEIERPCLPKRDLFKNINTINAITLGRICFRQNTTNRAKNKQI